LARLTLTILQAQNIAEGSIVEQKNHALFEQKKNHKAVSMVITLTQGLTLTILQAQSTWERTRLSRQKLSPSPRQIYDLQAASVVSTIALRPVATKKSRVSCLIMAWQGFSSH
jgi:hypothetical protein